MAMVLGCSEVLPRWDEVVKTTELSRRSSRMSVPKGSPAAGVLTLGGFNNLLWPSGTPWRWYWAAQRYFQGVMKLLKQLSWVVSDFCDAWILVGRPSAFISVLSKGCARWSHPWRLRDAGVAQKLVVPVGHSCYSNWRCCLMMSICTSSIRTASKKAAQKFSDELRQIKIGWPQQKTDDTPIWSWSYGLISQNQLLFTECLWLVEVVFELSNLLCQKLIILWSSEKFLWCAPTQFRSGKWISESEELIFWAGLSL